MNVTEAALEALMTKPGWSVQLRSGSDVVAVSDATPRRDGDGWLIDVVFGPFGMSTRWSDVVVIGPGVEESEPDVTSIPPGRMYRHTIRYGGTD